MTYTQHMRSLFLFLPLTLLFTAVAKGNEKKDPLRAPLDKPNVIIVYLDDAGYGDFAFTGNKTVETPQLDKLSSQGLFFTNFHAGSPACTASRYALITGKSPARSGLGTWVLYPEQKAYINPKEQTTAETLKKAGYTTGIIGKWHLGVPNKANNYDTQALPAAHGFDSYMGIPYSNDMKPSPLIKQPGNSEEYPGAEVLENPVKQTNLTQTYFQAACDFVKKNKDHPFYLHLTPSMPHTPLYAGDGYRGKARSGKLYDDVIQEIDDQMGKLVQTVDKEGLGRNTLIIFSSDNGPWLLQGKHGGSALPYRDGKGSTFEGGTRVPGLFRWTGVIAPGKKDNVTSVLDVHPTIAALVGQSIEPYGTLDGRNIAYLLNEKLGDKPVKDEEYTLIMTGKSKNTPMTAQCGTWKIHFDTYSQLWGSKINDHNSPPIKASLEQPLLYDLSKDIAETTNVADQHPEIVEKLKTRFLEFRQSIDKESKDRQKDAQ